MKTIRWGMIGCGSVTEVKSGPAFNKAPHSKLMAVMRRDAEKVKKYAERHQVPYYFTNANDLINHPEVDAIYIATPPKFHEAYAIEAMQVGKPVYVEKPMGLDVAACERMNAYSKKSSITLVIAHYRRALPLFVEVKRLLDAKIIGDIISVRIDMLKYDSGLLDPVENWRIDPSLSGGGYFYDLAPHQLDLVFYFFGKAKSYKGTAYNKANLYKAEDTVTGEIELENGIQFKGNWCFCVDKGEETDIFEIIGTKGKISFPVFGHTITLTTGEKQEQIHFDPPKHNQQNFIEKIVTYLNGVGENPCSAEDALQSMRVMEAFVYGNNK